MAKIDERKLEINQHWSGSTKVQYHTSVWKKFINVVLVWFAAHLWRLDLLPQLQITSHAPAIKQTCQH